MVKEAGSSPILTRSMSGFKDWHPDFSSNEGSSNYIMTKTRRQQTFKGAPDWKFRKVPSFPGSSAPSGPRFRFRPGCWPTAWRWLRWWRHRRSSEWGPRSSFSLAIRHPSNQNESLNRTDQTVCPSKSNLASNSVYSKPLAILKGSRSIQTSQWTNPSLIKVNNEKVIWQRTHEEENRHRRSGPIVFDRSLGLERALPRLGRTREIHHFGWRCRRRQRQRWQCWQHWRGRH